MNDIVTEAAKHLTSDQSLSGPTTLRLPYIWAYGLCMAGRRLGFMQWLHQFCSAFNLMIESVRDGEDGSVLFVTAPIQQEATHEVIA